MSDLDKHLRAMREAADREERERQERSRKAAARREREAPFRDRYALVNFPGEARFNDVPATHAAVIEDFARRLPAGEWKHAGWIVEDDDGTPRFVGPNPFVHIGGGRRHRLEPFEFVGPDGTQYVHPDKAGRHLKRLNRAVERAKRRLDHDGTRVRIVHVSRGGELVRPSNDDQGAIWAPILVSVHLLDLGDRVVGVNGRGSLHHSDRFNDLTWGTMDEFAQACAEMLFALERGGWREER